jgi:DedD protein
LDKLLKQRLVGALILVALGVVFWPIIFVEPQSGLQRERAAIPEPPMVEDKPVVSPDMAGLRPSNELQSQRQREAEDQFAVAEDRLLEAEQAEPASLVESEREPATEDVEVVAPTPVVTPVAVESQPGSRTRGEPPVTPQIDTEGVPVAWILQVVTVSDEQRAQSLRKQLLDMDQKAYVKKIRRNDRSLYRVYIGPGFEKTRMEAVKPIVDSKLGVNSVVQRYLP